MRWDAVSAYGASPLAETPNLDKLAEEGVLFTAAYCQAQVCAPSRHSFITGTYPHKNGVYAFEKNHKDVPFWKPFITEYLSEKNYQNGLFGKYGWHIMGKEPDGTYGHRYSPFYDAYVEMGAVRWLKMAAINGYGGGNEIWNPAPPVGKTPDEAFGLLRAYSWEFNGKPSEQIIGGYNPREIGQHEEDAYGWFMKDWIKNRIDQTKPFFAHFNVGFPHTPILPPKEYALRFEKKVEQLLKELPPIDEKEIASYGPQMRHVYNWFKTVGLSDADQRKYIAHYYADCAYGDEILGRVIRDFKAACGDRPWLIVFHADNGFHIGEHGFGAKWTFYDQSTHMPLIVASSDKTAFPAGTVVDDPVELVDVVPTVLAFAGYDLNETRFSHLDGRDLAATIAGNVPPREYTLTEIGHFYGHRAGLRSKQWNFSMRTRPADMKIGQDYLWAARVDNSDLEIQLFDLVEDPEEKNNLANDPAHADTVAELKAELIRRVLDPDRIEYDWNKDLGTKSFWAYPYRPEDPKQYQLRKMKKLPFKNGEYLVP
jgi:arylsulfatase A-like enzyme